MHEGWWGRFYASLRNKNQHPTVTISGSERAQVDKKGVEPIVARSLMGSFLRICRHKNQYPAVGISGSERAQKSAKWDWTKVGGVVFTYLLGQKSGLCCEDYWVRKRTEIGKNGVETVVAIGLTPIAA